MSEHNPSHEHTRQHETMVSTEQLEKLQTDLHKRAERATQAAQETDIEALRRQAETHSESAASTKVDRLQDAPSEPTLGMRQVLKSKAYEHTLSRIRQKLPRPARSFSKFAHNKTIDAVSAAGAQTIARPSGLLGGSLVAFTGSLALLYYSRHYGFRYNYALFLILFVGGFAAGILIELAVWALYSRKRHRY